MWDTICNLPLSSDLISLATHPSEPILAIGLASGHVHVFRIPAPDESVDVQTSTEKSQDNASSNGASAPRRSSLTRSSTSPSPSNGYGCMTTMWQTRRHKGSCRSLAFSPDGSTLFSAGTDSLVKAAHATSGHVLGKIAMPTKAEPNVVCALSNQHLLLGDDEGGLHVYALEPKTSTLKPSPDAQPSKTTALVPRPTPETSTHPHATEEDPSAGHQPITSITPLATSSTSTSGIPRAWISTSGGTLAASDLRRGVIKVSIEQGGANAEELLASACAPAPAPGQTDLLLAADSSGLLSIWPRGAWEDRAAGVRVRIPPQQTPGIAVLEPDAFDAALECLAVRPPSLAPGNDGAALVACGLGSGAVRFVRVLPETASMRGGSAKGRGDFAAHEAQRRAARARVRVVDEAVQHDEHRFDGVACVAFDVRGRLISGGGALVKVWGWTDQAMGGDGESEDEDGEEVGSAKRAGDEEDEDEDEDEEESDSDDEPRRRRKKRRRRETTRAGKMKRGARGGDHGIAAIRGLD